MRNFVRRFWAGLFIIAICVSMCPAKTQAAKVLYGKVNCSTLSVRSSNSTKAKKLGSLDKGTVVTVVAEKDGWCKIKYNGGYAFVATEYLDHTTKKTAKASTLATIKIGSSASTVKKLQQRLCDLNYLPASKVNGTYGSSTTTAVKRFQLFNGLSITGKADEATQKKLASSKAVKRQKIQNWDWFNCSINKVLPKNGGTAYIIDVETGTRIDIRRVGGKSHADVEPSTAEDTKVLSKLYNGKFSWDRRAVILVVGKKFIAASINGQPHGKQISKKNNFNGHFCLHLTNSKTHESNKVDKNHQNCIKKALKWGNS